MVHGYIEEEIFRQALEEVRVAENQFNNCDPHCVDICIARVTAARERLNFLIYEKKGVSGNRKPLSKVNFKWWGEEKPRTARVYWFPVRKEAEV